MAKCNEIGYYLQENKLHKLNVYFWVESDLNNVFWIFSLVG